MLNVSEKSYLKQLVSRLDNGHKAWLAGYVQGLIDADRSDAITFTTPAPTQKITLYVASETGNGKKVAQGLEKTFKSNGVKVALHPFSKANPKKLCNEGTLIFVLSTHGEGAYPDSAKPLINKLESLAPTALHGIDFAIIGLGDSAYQQFCGAAINLQQLLQDKGAMALQPIIKLDVNFEEQLAWLNAELLQKLKISQAPIQQSVVPHTVTSTVGYSRLAPVLGTVENIINLNDIGSDRETYHLEISFNENLIFQPGDALGVILPAQADGTQPIPRLYSIASSLRLYPQEVHLTVARATYRNTDGTLGYGLCSNYLAQLQAGDPLKFYIHRNENFRLPEDDSADIIMVGVGTGIAPFRAFVQERVDRDATGQNILFFGNPHAHCDFLYQLEWQEYVENGVLDIHLAFSRDQQQKIYVQHRLVEQGAAIIAALDNGAYFYLCGAKIPMSQEVEQTLLDLLMQHKNLALDAARAYLDDLAEQGRYCKDVY